MINVDDILILECIDASELELGIVKWVSDTDIAVMLEDFTILINRESNISRGGSRRLVHNLGAL